MKVPKKVLAGHRAIWGGTIPPGALVQLKKEYARMPGKKKRKNPGKRKAAVLSAAQKALAKYNKRIAAERAAYAAAQKKQGTTGAVRLNPAPLRSVLKEAGARRVRVMRNKSGKATGVKFL